MFLKNYNALYPVMLTNHTGTTLFADKIVCADGTAPTIFTYQNSISEQASTIGIKTLLSSFLSALYTSESSSATCGVAFGTGNTDPTVDDYKLSGNFISGISSSNVLYDVSVERGEGETIITAIYTITNTTGADITIGEIALVGRAGGRNSSNFSSTFRNFLIERTALETPVTIPATKIGQVTYKITIKDPIA